MAAQIQWIIDGEEALNKAKRAGLPVLVDFFKLG